MLAQWVPLHAVSCSNLIETGGCAESREILLFECFPEKPREAFPFPPPFLPYFPFLFTASSSSSSFSSLLSLSSRYNNLDFTRTTTRYTLRGGSNFRRCGCLFPLSFSSSFFLFLFFFFFDARGMFCLFVGFDYRCMISVNADVTSAISSDSTVSAVARIFLGHTREFSNEFPTCHVQERRPRSTPPSRRSPCVDLPSKSVARRPLDIVRPSSSSTSSRIPPHLGTLRNNILCRWIYLFSLFSFLARRETRVFLHEAQTEHSSSYPRGKTSVGAVNSQRDGGGAWTESHRIAENTDRSNKTTTSRILYILLAFHCSLHHSLLPVSNTDKCPDFLTRAVK